MDFILPISQTFIIQQKIFVVIKTYCYNKIFSLLFKFLCSLLSSTKNEYVFSFNLTISLIATPAVLSFILPTTNLFQSSKYFDLAEDFLKSNISLFLLTSS